MFSITMLYAQSNEDCQMCHSDDELTTVRKGRTISLYVNEAVFNASVHGDLECVNCHYDADVDEFPHPEMLEKVSCGNCHGDAQEKFMEGIHGIALERGAAYAPTCEECHGEHDILPPSDVNSRTYKMRTNSTMTM